MKDLVGVCLLELLTKHWSTYVALREFVDGNGRKWKAWDTRPGASQLVRSDFSEGWVSFECDEEKRRFFPIPNGWHLMPTEELLTMLHEAVPVQARRGVE